MSPSAKRAWIEINRTLPSSKLSMSPSAKRAWIEILHGRGHTSPLEVALCEEGVDRNCEAVELVNEQTGSPSAKRAWIEIVCVDLKIG